MSTSTKKKQIKKTQIIGLKDLRVNMDKYIKAVDAGQSFTVVRRSKPIFAVTPLDEWGDPVGEWKPLLDFRELDSKGVQVEKIIAALKKLDR